MPPWVPRRGKRGLGSNGRRLSHHLVLRAIVSAQGFSESAAEIHVDLGQRVGDGHRRCLRACRDKGLRRQFCLDRRFVEIWF